MRPAGVVDMCSRGCFLLLCRCLSRGLLWNSFWFSYSGREPCSTCSSVELDSHMDCSPLFVCPAFLFCCVRRRFQCESERFVGNHIVLLCQELARQIVPQQQGLAGGQCLPRIALNIYSGTALAHLRSDMVLLAAWQRQTAWTGYAFQFPANGGLRQRSTPFASLYLSSSSASWWRN